MYCSHLIAFTAVLGNVFCLDLSPEYLEHLGRIKRDASDVNRPSCQAGSPQSAIRVDTAARVEELRKEIVKDGLDAYIIPSEDAHYSEYPSHHDQRRKYISGFSGSAGIAVVTKSKAALWTDGRYFLQAEDQLDCNWLLMRQGENNVPSLTEWLIEELDGATNKSVGVYPFVFSSSKWTSYVAKFSGTSVSLVKVNGIELIDRIWTVDRPDQPSTTINALDIKFAGLSWEDKLTDIQIDMIVDEVDVLVVTKLDETAWMFNIRGKDIDFNPFFISYAIIEKNRTRLFIIDHSLKLEQTAATKDKDSTQVLKDHLNTQATGQCEGRTGKCVEVLEYNPMAVVDAVQMLVNSVDTKKVWISPSCNYAIFSVIPKNKQHQKNTPIALQKIRKNAVERQGMKNSHIRDAVALISFLVKLEKEVKSGIHWTELKAARELKLFREQKEYNRGLSFQSISGSGANGAIIHYSVTNQTDTAITTDKMYLLDSGGQYLDGTTDVTRTFHFGTPTDKQKECYTRVLMGQIDLALAIWPYGLYGRNIDAFARAPLWDVGLIYRHGTGHGIGAYLSVHEDPGGIYFGGPNDVPLDQYFFLSDEPGYYEDGEFGIRLENIIMVTEKTTKYKFPNSKFLGFEQITLVPYEPHLIDFSLLDTKQKDYLIKYNKDIMDRVGPPLKNNAEAYDWMEQRVQAISSFINAGNHRLPSISLLILSTVFLSLLCINKL